MTREEFMQKYRGRFLLFLTEAWAVRKEAPSSLGLVMDGHAQELRRLLAEIYDDLAPAPGKPVPANGRAAH